MIAFHAYVPEIENVRQIDEGQVAPLFVIFGSDDGLVSLQAALDGVR